MPIHRTLAASAALPALAACSENSAAIFRSGGNVLNLAQASGRDELEIRIENGFHGRGSGSDDD